MRLVPARAITLCAIGACLVGCNLFYGQRDGPAIADAIREASPPSVLDVHYQDGDYMDGATVNVTMAGTVSEAEAFMCGVVDPIVRNADPPDGLGVWIWDPNEEVLAVDWDTSCP